MPNMFPRAMGMDVQDDIKYKTKSQSPGFALPVPWRQSASLRTAASIHAVAGEDGA